MQLWPQLANDVEPYFPGILDRAVGRAAVDDDDLVDQRAVDKRHDGLQALQFVQGREKKSDGPLSRLDLDCLSWLAGGRLNVHRHPEKSIVLPSLRRR